MANYKDSILRHEKDVNRLHDAVHETFKHRDKSKSHRETWIKAAAQYRNHHSSIDDWIKDIERSEIFDWEDARDFTFQYFNVDPVYFGSGYTKEMLVRKVKKCELTRQEAETLRTLIVRRIQSGGQRDFKQFCKLIPKIQNTTFLDEVHTLANAKDKNVSSRAKIAMRRFNDT